MASRHAKLRYYEAVEQGAAARRDGRPRDACPYRPSRNGGCQMAWLHGWEREDCLRREESDE